ncbi:LacI family DNA-binding transcriptional regulator [Streptomyces sp. SID4917]|nr:LacI family DNA-binding transcriptional regulator [Streptomyces sp. SID4917]
MGGTWQPGPALRQVAEPVGVSTGTVSNVLNRPAKVAEATRVRVEKAIADVGFVRQVGPAREAAHWRRSGHAAWIFPPAATGWYPRRPLQPHHRLDAGAADGAADRGLVRVAGYWPRVVPVLPGPGTQPAVAATCRDAITPRMLQERDQGRSPVKETSPPTRERTRRRTRPNTPTSDARTRS